MSLTLLLTKNQEVKELFKAIPNVKPLFKSYFDDLQPFDKPLMNVPYPKDLPIGQTSLIGTVYDVFLNMYIQRINELEDAGDQFNKVIEGVGRLSYYLSDAELDFLVSKVEIFFEMKHDFIDGKQINEIEFLRHLALIGNVIIYYRSGYFFDVFEFHSSVINDLLGLKHYTETRIKYFKNVDQFTPNPHFGKNSILIGGADGDFILNDMLVDVKSTKSFGYSVTHIRQLLGYHILNQYNKQDDSVYDIHDFNKLAIFFPRQDRFVYLEIKELEKIFDIDDFASKFFNIVKRR